MLGLEQAAAHDGNGSLTEVSVATQSRAQTAILEATERLLRERPLRRLSVADIIEAAGVSRTSFYAYFASKTAVIAECLREVMDQVMVAVRPFHAQSGGDAEAAIRVSLRAVGGGVQDARRAAADGERGVAPRRRDPRAVVRDARDGHRGHGARDPLRAPERPGAGGRRSPGARGLPDVGL